MFYPTKTFHHWIQVLCSFQKVQTLTAFMELYQGHFKFTDETDNVCPLLSDLNYFLMLISHVVWSLIIITFAPYKTNVDNKLECLLAHYITVIMASSSYLTTQKMLNQQSLHLHVTWFLPAIVIPMACCIWISKQYSCSCK